MTHDHVNPEAPWPELEALGSDTAAAGKVLVERLAIYPELCCGSRTMARCARAHARAARQRLGRLCARRRAGRPARTGAIRMRASGHGAAAWRQPDRFAGILDRADGPASSLTRSDIVRCSPRAATTFTGLRGGRRAARRDSAATA